MEGKVSILQDEGVLVDFGLGTNPRALHYRYKHLLDTLGERGHEHPCFSEFLQLCATQLYIYWLHHL